MHIIVQGLFFCYHLTIKSEVIAMEEYVERLMLFGYSEEESEMIVESVYDSEGYRGVEAYLQEKERELYVY